MKNKLLFVLLACSCAPRGEHRPQKTEVVGIETVATGVFGIAVAPKPTTETSGNLVAMRTGTFTITQRTDSRTWFVRNQAYGALSDDGVFDGPDEVLRRTAARILKGLNIDPAEVVRERVPHLLQGAGEFDEATGQATADLWESKQSVLTMRRQLGDIPVFSSRMYLALTANGDIGRLKLHWPEIPAPVIEEARRYQKIVRDGFKPRGDEKIVSITAGIIHSSSRSRMLDVLPVIRVEYAAGAQGMPRIAYLDPSGQKVRPRHDDRPPPLRENKPSATAVP